MQHTRRQFFAGIARTLADGVSRVITTPIPALAEPLSEPSPEVETLPVQLRPPGALPEEAFLEACTRCIDCIKACPYDSIRRLGPEAGLASGTPVIIPHESPCYLCKDLPCIAACPTDALTALPREQVRMAEVHIHLEQCYLSEGQPCDYCVSRCPLKSQAIGFNESGLPQIHEEHCAGCGVCMYLCPGNAIELRLS